MFGRAKHIIACLVPGILLSCATQLDPLEPGAQVSFRATRELVAKTALKGNDVFWSEGDRVAVFSGGHKAEFKSSDISGSSCTFSGILPDGGDVYAIYPFSDEAEGDGGVVSAALPAVQKAIRGGFDPNSALAIARASKAGDDMTFRNAGALVSFSVSAETAEDLVEVILKSTCGTPLSGKADFQFEGGVPVSRVSEGSDQVVLQGRFTEGTYYFVVLPGTHSGLSLTFRKAKSSGRMTSSFAGRFERGTISDMGTLSPASWEDSDNYRPVTLELKFSNGSAFLNPFEYPDLTSISASTSSASYMGVRKELGLSVAEGGYVFAVFGSKGVTKSANGLAFGSSAGDYFEFPAIPGLCLNRVILTTGGAISGMNVSSADGRQVLGGENVQTATASGDIIEWTLYGSERSNAYRLQNAGPYFHTIRSIRLEYGLDPLPIPTGDISPFDYGLRDATTGEERFRALDRAHRAALSLGVSVDYTGVGTVDLVIPSGAKSIPLSRRTDFKGTVFKVHNDVSKIFLFNMENVFTNISVSGKQVDNADYSSSSVLSGGLHILKIQDGNHWVDDRQGFYTSHDRADAVLVRDGEGSCGPVSSYSTTSTIIKAEWCAVDDSLKYFKNVSLVRDASSSQMACLVDFRGQNNLLISNVRIETPYNTGMCGDTALDIRYCTNVVCEDMVFDGLYCEEHGSGYGLSINTTWNTTFRRISSHNLWAAFGCNNMQDSFLEDSDVERFDIHCYGKNITIRNSTLTGKGLPCSSVYGTILCENVKFVNCFIFSYRADYNAYVPFDLVVRNCEYWPSGQNGIMNVGRIDKDINPRAELARKYWPNIDVDGLKVHLGTMPSLSCYYMSDGQSYPDSIGYVSSVKLRNVEYIYSSTTPLRTYVATFPVTFENKFELLIDSCSFMPEGVSGNARVTTNVRSSASSKVVNTKAYVD